MEFTCLDHGHTVHQYLALHTDKKKENGPLPGPGNYQSSSNIGKNTLGWKYPLANPESEELLEMATESMRLQDQGSTTSTELGRDLKSP